MFKIIYQDIGGELTSPSRQAKGKKDFFLMQNNASIYKVGVAMKWFRVHKIEVIVGLLYLSNLNPIENIYAVLKNKLYK